MTSDIGPGIRELRVMLGAVGDEAFIIGSCHTFPGRFAVWVPRDHRARCVSKADVVEASQEAQWWMLGFLHGSVPEPPEDPAKEDDWQERRRIFLETGDWPRLGDDATEDDS